MNQSVSHELKKEARTQSKAKQSVWGNGNEKAHTNQKESADNWYSSLSPLNWFNKRWWVSLF